MSIRKTCAVIPFLIVSSVSGVNAEVKLDGTLGTHGNIAGPNYAIEAAMGKQQGASLFHSFEKFNVGTGESAVFRGPADVERIISRVTGGSASNIDGLIKSEIQGADFYFINPFGMIFGPNASLDITGSFYATSADYVRLGENGRFDAKNPENTVLTADAPEKFGFLGQKPGDITVQARRETGGIDSATGKPEYSGLEVIGDSRMMLSGGDIKIDNGVVQTHSGSLDVAAVSSAGELDISDPDMNGFESLGKIELHNEGGIYSNEGGNIRCLSDSVEVTSNSYIETTADKSIPKTGDIYINARNSVTVSGSGNGLKSGIGSFVKMIPDTDSGKVSIDTGYLCISDGALILSQSIGSGDSGNINIHASGIVIEKWGELFTDSSNGGNAGDIDIKAADFLHIYDRGKIYSACELSENSHGGDVSIKSPELIIEKNGGVGTTSSNADNSGNIIIDVVRLNLFEGGDISTSISSGEGSCGDIFINASESLLIKGTGKFLDTAITSNGSESEGAGGNLSIKTPEIVIDNMGCLSTVSRGSGFSGNIVLDVARLNLLDGSSILTFTFRGAGKAGDIDIKASESVLGSYN